MDPLYTVFYLQHNWRHAYVLEIPLSELLQKLSDPKSEEKRIAALMIFIKQKLIITIRHKVALIDIMLLVINRWRERRVTMIIICKLSKICFLVTNITFITSICLIENYMVGSSSFTVLYDLNNYFYFITNFSKYKLLVERVVTKI